MTKITTKVKSQSKRKSCSKSTVQDHEQNHEQDEAEAGGGASQAGEGMQLRAVASCCGSTQQMVRAAEESKKQMSGGEGRDHQARERTRQGRVQLQYEAGKYHIAIGRVGMSSSRARA